MKMKTEKFHHYLEIWRLDDLQEERRWIYQCNAYAKVESLFNHRAIGNEIAFAKRVISSNFYRFTLRLRKDIETNMKIVFNEQHYLIIKIVSDFAHRKLMYLIAEEL